MQKWNFVHAYVYIASLAWLDVWLWICTVDMVCLVKTETWQNRPFFHLFAVYFWNSLFQVSTCGSTSTISGVLFDDVDIRVRLACLSSVRSTQKLTSYSIWRSCSDTVPERDKKQTRNLLGILKIQSTRDNFFSKFHIVISTLS